MIEFTSKKSQKLSCYVSENIEGISYSYLMKLLRKKDVKVNGKRVSTDIMLNQGDSVIFYNKDSEISSYIIIFSDENVVVVDKKSGFTSERVFSDLQKVYDEIYFIHRLDRNTSGVMIFALNKQSETELLKGFKNHKFDKRYLAEVYGVMPKKQEVLTAYLFKDSNKAMVKIFDSPVKGAVQIKTAYTLLNAKEKSSIIEVKLYTGKTHQIRAHLSYIGHFVLGDGKYGIEKINKEFGIKSQKLIAYKLTLLFEKGSYLFYLNSTSFESRFKI